MEIRRIAKQFIASGNPNRIVCEFDSAKPSVPTAAGKINIARIPVNLLLDPLFGKIDEVHPSVTLSFLGSSHYRGRNQFG